MVSSFTSTQRGSPVLVTIISDASHCPDTLAGGYGCWIASNRGSMEFGGPLNDAMDSTEIEAKAACNALHYAITNGLVKRRDIILIQVDALAALEMFNGRRKPRLRELEILEWINNIAARNDLTLRYRHVKGHTNNRDARSRAQQKCDDLARHYMQQERGKRRSSELLKEVRNSKPKRKPRPQPKREPIEETWARKLKLLVRGEL